MCSLIIYLHCAPLEPQFRLEIKMIWNWLLGLFTNENMLSINFELLKEIGAEHGTTLQDQMETPNESSTSNSSPFRRTHLLPDLQLSHLCFANQQCNQPHASQLPANELHVNPLDANQANHLRSSRPNASQPLASPPNSKTNELHSIKPASNLFDLQHEKYEESAKLNKFNSNSLPDLVPEEERRRQALKEIGIKLRHISESFERSRKRWTGAVADCFCTDPGVNRFSNIFFHIVLQSYLVIFF